MLYRSYSRGCGLCRICRRDGVTGRVWEYVGTGHGTGTWIREEQTKAMGKGVGEEG